MQDAVLVPCGQAVVCCLFSETMRARREGCCATCPCRAPVHEMAQPNGGDAGLPATSGVYTLTQHTVRRVSLFHERYATLLLLLQLYILACHSRNRRRRFICQRLHVDVSASISMSTKVLAMSPRLSMAEVRMLRTW